MPGRWLCSESGEGADGGANGGADGGADGGPPRLAVLDVEGRPRDPAVAVVARRLAAAGTEVVARVDTDFGLRPLADVRADLRRHQSWYGVMGAFLDQAAACGERLGHYRAIAASVPGAVVLNPGVYPDPAYAELADVLVTFDGPLAAYRAMREPSWARELDRARFCHVIHDVPGAARAAVLRRASRYAGVVVVRPWTGAPAPRGRAAVAT
ncbi:Spherulation-specific family 4 [Nonomuraea pusilla]|uniref:Spherulation-specific family 4 n=1 Tax=Nonomuraea pusilla TaxID=46177 RepID=A0A1H7MWL1_9ACTN|nr:Spherulation-specific family 4 [Nonomuraea pusilla]